MSAESRPQLMYFDVPGRVAGLRILLFTIFGKDGWEDRRVAFENWPGIKPTLGLQCLPVLTVPSIPEHDQTKGQQKMTSIHQAEAMMRWAGRKAGLYPSDADAALFVDEMMSTIYEALSKAPRPSSLVRKEMLPQLWKEFTEGETAPMHIYFNYIQERIAGPFFGGDELSVADLTLYMLVNYFVNGEIPHISPDYVENGFPRIKTHHAAVKNHPIVKAYDAAYADKSDAVDQVKEFENNSGK